MENYFIRGGQIGLRSIREDDREAFFVGMMTAV